MSVGQRSTATPGTSDESLAPPAVKLPNVVKLLCIGMRSRAS
jgi:hypothetical protein